MQQKLFEDLTTRLSSQHLKYMGWFFSFGTNASVLSCNNVGRCHFYRRLLTCIPSLRAYDLACPRHRSCAFAPVRWVLHDNASAHTEGVVSALLNCWGWEVLYHPPYSPDISPCDYDLIPKMPMREKRYRTIEDIKQAAERSLRTINRLGSANRIQRLPRRWEHVVHNGWDYVEGLWNLEPSRWAIYPVLTLVPKLKNQPMYNSEIFFVIDIEGHRYWVLLNFEIVILLKQP